MLQRFLVLGALCATVSSHALLVEKFTNSQVDYVPEVGFGLAPNSTNGYLYVYKDASSSVYRSGTTTAVTAATLATAAAYQVPNGLAFDIALGAAANPYAGIGFDWKKASGVVKLPIDLSAHTSVIVQYSATRPILLEWQQSDDPDDGSAYFCQLPAKTVVGYHACALPSGTDINGFADSTIGFKQPYWVSTPRSFDKTGAIALKFALKSGVPVAISLKSVFLDDTTQNWPVVSSSSVAVSSSVVVSSSSADPLSSSTVVSSSSVVVVSSSTVVVSSSTVPSSSSVAPVVGLIWTPTLLNQIQNAAGELGGYWYTYASVSAGALSTVTPVADSIAANVTANGALSVAFSNKQGGTNPVAAVGFDWVDAGAGPTVAYNITGSTGLCFEYQSSAILRLTLKQARVADSLLNDGGDYFVNLPASPTKSVQSFVWSQFALPGWYTDVKKRYTNDLTKQYSVHLQFTSPAANATAKIYKVGFGSACGTPVNVSSSSGVVVSSSSRPSSSSAPVVSSSSGAISSSTGPSSSAIVASSSSGAVATCTGAGKTMAAFACQDADGDGMANWAEDTDGDGTQDYAEDDDGDGVLNWADANSPFHPGATPLLGVTVQERGLGFVRMDTRSIVFRVEDAGMASLQVFDGRGKQVANLFQGNASGEMRVQWNGSLYQGGIYYLRLESMGRVRVTRAVLTH